MRLLTSYKEVQEVLKEKELRNVRLAFEYKIALAGDMPATANLEKTAASSSTMSLLCRPTDIIIR